MQVTCPGLPAEWVSAWLAAVGATVLDPRIRLHWSAEAPVAVLSSTEFDPVEVLAESWPAEALAEWPDAATLPIADNWNDAGVMDWHLPVGQFVERANGARSHPHAWTLSSTMTDLTVAQKTKGGQVVDVVTHGAFNPPVPGGLTLHNRLRTVGKEALKVQEAGRLPDALMGKTDRVQGNGLGFDVTRIGSLGDKSSPWIDPVVEVLAFFGLKLFPVRGRGVVGSGGDVRQRGWRKTDRRAVFDHRVQPHLRSIAPRSKERRFLWPAWGQPLDAFGIDALLDVWDPSNKPTWAALGVHAAWQSVSYQRRGSSDTSKAIGSEML